MGGLDDPRTSDLPADNVGDAHYVREAFNNQYNWIALAAVLGFALVSTSALPLVVGAGAELIYLSLVSQNDRFRRLVRSRLAQLQKMAGSEPEKIQSINHKRVEILNMRLEKLKRIRENLQMIDAQSSAIEDVLGLVRDQSITMRDPQSVSNQLGDLVHDVEQTEDCVREVESLFESPSSEEIQALPARLETPAAA